MSLLAKTEHLPATLGGCSLFKARWPKASMVRPILKACWSRNEPVPAAHTEFIWKSAMRSFPSSPSGAMKMSLASWPPISIMVLASGWKTSVAFAWAMTSFVKAAPMRGAISFPPEPVAATSFMFSFPYLWIISERMERDVSSGSPLVLV